LVDKKRKERLLILANYSGQQMEFVFKRVNMIDLNMNCKPDFLSWCFHVLEWCLLVTVEGIMQMSGQKSLVLAT